MMVDAAGAAPGPAEHNDKHACCGEGAEGAPAHKMSTIRARLLGACASQGEEDSGSEPEAIQGLMQLAGHSPLKKRGATQLQRLLGKPDFESDVSFAPKRIKTDQRGGEIQGKSPVVDDKFSEAGGFRDAEYYDKRSLHDGLKSLTGGGQASVDDAQFDAESQAGAAGPQKSAIPAGALDDNATQSQEATVGTEEAAPGTDKGQVSGVDNNTPSEEAPLDDTNTQGGSAQPQGRSREAMLLDAVLIAKIWPQTVPDTVTDLYTEVRARWRGVRWRPKDKEGVMWLELQKRGDSFNPCVKWQVGPVTSFAQLASRSIKHAEIKEACFLCLAMEDVAALTSLYDKAEDIEQQSFRDHLTAAHSFVIDRLAGFT